MSHADNKAVFISYASQDAEAVRRICEALRSAGVEVWFDQNELVGGDAWDAKIRKQIKECALFMPVISAATQARAEGYFRLEWKLAVDRSHLMADDTPFLFPVVIDATPDATARVPDKFREVQWTRLNGKDTPETLAARVGKLLGGALEEKASHAADSSAKGRRHTPHWVRYAAILAGLTMGVAYAVRPWFRPSRHEMAKPAATAPVTSSEAAGLSERAYALTQKLNFTREDLGTAESLAQRATDLAPDSSRAWSVRAWVQASYLMRNWDRSEQRMQATQTLANHALALNADEPDALNALAQIMELQGASVEEEKLARRVMAIDPQNFRSRMLLGRALLVLGRTDEGRAVLREAVALDSSKVLARYELGNSYVGFGFGHQPESMADVDAALEQFDAALAQQPFTSALLTKAVVLASRKGDLKGMRAQLDRLDTLPLSERTLDRAMYVSMIAGLWEREPARVLKAATLTTQTYFEDTVIASPKAWLTAQAYRLEGKENSARNEWQAAEAILRQRLHERPDDVQLTVQLAITLAWLERNDEADRLIAPLESLWREQMIFYGSNFLAHYYAARGDAAKAVPYLRQALNRNSFVTDTLLSFDPWWDKLRGQPEFDALLKGR